MSAQAGRRQGEQDALQPRPVLRRDERRDDPARRPHRGRELELDPDRRCGAGAELRGLAQRLELEIDAGQVADVRQRERSRQHVHAIVRPEHVERIGAEHARAGREIDRVLVAHGHRSVRARGPEYVDPGRAEEQREDPLRQPACHDEHVAAVACLIVERTRATRREQARARLDPVAPQVADDAVREPACDREVELTAVVGAELVAAR